MHIPVLLQSSIDNLQLQSGLRVLDATLDLAGHAEAFLSKIMPDGFLVGIDQDQRNLQKAESRLSPYAKNTKLIHANFADLDQLAFTEKFDRIFFDLGVSSPHLDEAERGFSFRQDGPLDMRMDLDQEFTAADLVNTYSERELFRVIKDYGEEPMAYLIAKMIVKKRQIRPWTSTQELATAIDDLLFKNKNRHKHPALLTFQALRIEVNGELDALKKALYTALDILAINGIIAVISYHSLEDRIVKNCFRDETRDCICPPSLPICQCHHSPRLALINRKPIVPDETEVQTNPRSRSAKLRLARKIHL